VRQNKKDEGKIAILLRPGMTPLRRAFWRGKPDLILLLRAILKAQGFFAGLAGRFRRQSSLAAVMRRYGTRLIDHEEETIH